MHHRTGVLFLPVSPFLFTRRDTRDARKRSGDLTGGIMVDYVAAIKSSQRPSISRAYRFSFALIAYYDSIAACTGGAQSGKRNNECASNEIESRINAASAISRLLARAGRERVPGKRII